jgi:uncharacterized protein (DUF2236 family)
VSAAPELVERPELEEALARVKALARDPRAGVFGPDTKLWEVNKEAIVFLGAGRAALLQLAHPFVATAIDQHSKTRDDPFGRFQRTFFHVFNMVYGDLDGALRAARAVWGIHTRITGTLPDAAGAWPAGQAYFANEPEALLWVHATLWDTSVLCFEHVVRPLGDDEKARYYEETKRFAWLFGIPDRVLPPDWPAFRAYVDGMLAGDQLHVVPAAREMGQFLFEPLLPGLGPLMRHYRLLTAWLLPEHLANGFGLVRGGEAGRRRFESTLRRLRTVYPNLPRRLRYLPAYVEARRRLAGRTGWDPIGETMTKLLVGRARLG